MTQILLLIGFFVCILGLIWLFLKAIGYGPDQIFWHEECDVLMSNVANMEVTEKNYQDFEQEFENLKDMQGFDKRRFQECYVNFLHHYKHYTAVK